MYKKIAVIILNWNGMAFLFACLGSLLKQDYPNLEIILVDNGSTDGSQVYVQGNFPSVRTILLDNNLGFDVPNNMAMKEAVSSGANYLFLVNNDVILASDAVSKLIHAGESDPTIGALGPVQLKYGDPTQIVSAGGYYDWKRGIVVQNEAKPSHNREVKFLSGAALMLKKTVLEKVGMLDEEYYFYGEDVDLCTRIINHGFKLVCVASSIVEHHVRGSTAKSPFHTYHITRTRWILMRKHASLFAWLYFIPFFVKNSLLGEFLWNYRHNLHDENRAMMRAIRDSFMHRISAAYLEPLQQKQANIINKL